MALFPSQELLLQHFETCLIFKCLECNKQFASGGTLKIHFLTKHCEGELNIRKTHDFTCESCCKDYLESLENIYAYYPKYNKIMCSDCQWSLSACSGDLDHPISKSSPSPEFITLEEIVCVESNSSDSDTSVARNVGMEVACSFANTRRLRKPRKSHKKNYQKMDLSCFQQNVTPTHNALLKYQTNIDLLFKDISLKAFSADYSCRVCSSKFKTCGYLRVHYTKFHPIKKVLIAPGSYVCTYCKAKFKSFEQIRNHFYQNHIPFLKCVFCDLNFSTVRERNLHSKDSHSGISHCRFCFQIFYCKDKLKEHHTWHQTEESVKCDTCNKMLIGMKKLRMHQANHKKKLMRSKGYKTHRKQLCLTCGKLLCHSAYLYHIKELHKNFQNSSVQCATCGKLQKSSKHYYLHRRMVHEKHLFIQCPNCPKKFPFPHMIKKHQAVCCKGILGAGGSLSTKSVKCDVCGEVFKSENILTTHLRKKHRKVVRRFACRHCPDTFIRNDARLVHERIHTGERPYNCRVCGQLCHITDCKRHENRHPGKMPTRARKVREKRQTSSETVVEEVTEDLGYYVEYEAKSN